MKGGKGDRKGNKGDGRRKGEAERAGGKRWKKRWEGREAGYGYSSPSPHLLLLPTSFAFSPGQSSPQPSLPPLPVDRSVRLRKPESLPSCALTALSNNDSQSINSIKKAEGGGKASW